ncbi:MAG: hypothetical protein JWL70_923, partial [Acidimicrobiia bacterium]|nr:hypothetical protein [Acidimicrobiia bacterium]
GGRGAWATWAGAGGGRCESDRSDRMTLGDGASTGGRLRTTACSASGADAAGADADSIDDETCAAGRGATDSETASVDVGPSASTAPSSPDDLPPFLAGLTGFGSSGCWSRTRPSRSARRRTRSACASSIPEEWLFTPMPRAMLRSSASLFVRPSSLASSWTLIFPATCVNNPFVNPPLWSDPSVFHVH